MEKFAKGLNSTYKWVVTGLFVAIMTVLSLLSIISTAYVSGAEKVFFVPDNLFVNLFIVALILAVVTYLKKQNYLKWLSKVNDDDVLYRKYRRIILWVIFGVSAFWVLSTQYAPRSDQLVTQQIVNEMLNRDFSGFKDVVDYFMLKDDTLYVAADGYISMYTNQLGLVLLSYIFAVVFGANNFIAFQLCNAVALTCFYGEITNICDRIRVKNSVKLVTLIMGLMFTPLIMYCSFVYGNILGLLFSIIAVSRALMYFKNRKTADMLISVLAIMLAMLFKSNYLISWVAVLIIVVLDCVRNRKLKNIVFPILLVVVLIVQSVMPVAIMRSVTGERLDHGMSSWAWVAMGLQDGSRAPGWHNTYNYRTYVLNNYDGNLQGDEAKAESINRIKALTSDGDEFIRFFSQKTVSQWCNPDFQSYWINKSNHSMIERSRLVWSLTNINGEITGDLMLNLYMSVVMIGALIYCFVRINAKSYTRSLVLPLIFVGGFLFHLVWEAKAQYTITYFVLLIPYAIIGFDLLTDRLAVIKNSNNLKAMLKSTTGAVKAVFTVFALTLIVVIIALSGRTNYINGDSAEYEEYLGSSGIGLNVTDGDYYILTADGKFLVTGDEVGQDANLLALSSDSVQLMTITNSNGYLFISGNSQNLTVTDETNPNHAEVCMSYETYNDTQKWHIYHYDEDSFIIEYQYGQYLTYDDVTGEVYVTEYNEEANQRWLIYAE